MGPVSISIHISGEIQEIARNVQTAATSGYQVINTQNNINNSLMASLVSTFNSYSSSAILDTITSPGQNTPTVCGSAVKSVTAKRIAKKFKKYFLVVKSSKGADINEVKEYRSKFYIDSLYVILAAAQSIATQMNDGDWDAKITAAQSCITDGSCTSINLPEGGNNENIFIYGEALRTYDSLLKMKESVVALKAQLAAIKVMHNMDLSVATETELKDDDSSTTTTTTTANTTAVSSDTSSDTASSDITSGESNAINGEQQALLTDGYRIAHYQMRTVMPQAFAQVSYNSKINTLEAALEEVSDSDASGLVSGSVEWSEPEEDTSEHPLAAAQDKLDALDEVNDISSTLEDAINLHNKLSELSETKETAEKIKEEREKYQEYLDRLKTSEQCSINFMKRYFVSPITSWSGVDLRKYPYQNDLREGISGWAVEAYSVAKAAETSTTSTEDYGDFSVDDETVDSIDNAVDFDKVEDLASSDANTLSKSKEEQAQDDARKSNLIAWQIGAEAAKLLGEEGEKWGERKANSMVWNDTKSFYGQYLQKKYDNIKAYLKSYTENDILALVLAKMYGQDVSLADTTQQRSISALQTAFSQAEDEAQQQKNTKIQEIDSTANANLKALESEREALSEKMDEVNARINERKQKISDMRDEAAEKAKQGVEDAYDGDVVYPESESDEGSATSTVPLVFGAESIQTSYKQGRTDNLDTEAVKTLEDENAEDQKLLQKYEAEQTELDEKIVQAKLDAQQTKTDLDTTLAAEVQNRQQGLTEEMTALTTKFGGDVSANLASVLSASIVVPSVDEEEDSTFDAAEYTAQKLAEMTGVMQGAAADALSEINAQVDVIVDASYAQLMALGDSLYSSESHDRIVKIHQQMISNLRAVTIAFHATGIVSLNIEVFAKLAAVDTSAETDGFFVGNPPKEKDLRAPFKLKDFDLPPVREVFHFDAVDFANVKPKVQGVAANRAVPKSDFLNFGGDIPLIWQYMLKDKAFIESDYDMTDTLNLGCEAVAFLRGGIMPCVVPDSNIVLDVTEEGKFVQRKDISTDSVPACLGLVLKKKKPYMSIFDESLVTNKALITVEKNKKTSLLASLTQSSQVEDVTCKYSELGMLFDIDESGQFAFRQQAMAVYDALLDDTDSEKLSSKDKSLRVLGSLAVLSRNQIGDFLRQSETEEDYRESLESAEQDYQDKLDEFKQQLIDSGYAPSTDFDLANDADYKKTVSAIKSAKKAKMAEAKAALAKISAADNEPVEEKKTQYTKLLTILETDTEGVLQLTMSSADSDDWKTELKQNTANNSAVSAYKTDAETQEESYNNPDGVYCSNY
jgi:hypothetical protein